MKKITFLGIFLYLSLLSFTAKAEINFDLTTVNGGILTLGYDDVSAERAKAQAERWITVVNFANSGTSGRCSGATKSFDIKSGRTIEFFLAKCDTMIINANIASGRGLIVNINNGPNITLNGTGACNDFIVPINSETPVVIKVQGLNSSSSWTSFFTLKYAEKFPAISSFVINGINANINQTTKQITLELPYGTAINAITPVITLGGTATGITPTGVQNFASGPVVYTVTSATETVEYTANITAKATPDTEKAISSMTINGKTATINETTGLISCEFPSFTGTLGNWPVTYTLNSTTANSTFTSGDNYDFSSGNGLNITVTAQDGSTKVYNVVPSISNKLNIGLLTLNGKAETYDDIFLSAFNNYYVNFLTASSTAPTDINAFYQNYDLIVLHPGVSGTNATGLASKAMVGVKPVLNLKAFFYNSGRWSWSTATPASSAAGIASVDVAMPLQSHPLFQNVTFNETTLTLYDNLPATNTNAIQYATDLASIGSLTSNTIATYNSTGIQIHEIQSNPAAKYLLIGLSIENNNFNYLNTNAVNLLKNAAGYLLNPTAQFSFIPTGLDNNLSETQPYYNNGFIHNPSKTLLRLYNTTGKLLLVSGEPTIDIQNIAKGVYIVETNNNRFKLLK